MEFRVGDIVAHCPKCGGLQFNLPEEEHSGPYMNYYCAGCGATTMYTMLMAQIGRETLRRKKERLSPDKHKQAGPPPAFLRRNP